MLRWAVNTYAALSLPQPAFDALVRLLDDDDALHVLKHRQREDQARALLSRLAQRACGVAALGLPPSPPKRGRAANGRGRPFLERAAASASADADAREALELAPNWNFSVSHEGEWVLLVSEPVALCGVDVAAPRRHRRPLASAEAAATSDADPHPFLRSLALLRDSLTDSEWEDVCAPLLVDSSSNVAAAEAAFLRAWAAKEAFVKARGDGLAFSPLSRVEAVWSNQARQIFADPEAVAEAARTGAALAVGVLRVDGDDLPRWTVASHPLEGGAWAAVVKGPASETAEARLHPDFVASLTRPEMLDGEGGGDGAPPPLAFRVLQVEDLLLTDEEREAFRRAEAV